MVWSGHEKRGPDRSAGHSRPKASGAKAPRPRDWAAAPALAKWQLAARRGTMASGPRGAAKDVTVWFVSRWVL